MSMEFPMQVSKQGVSVIIGRVEKDGPSFFRVLYGEQGKRKQAWCRLQRRQALGG
ncbi:MAG: hypothetical protein ABSF34_00880 [Verrucomicrobiota bacterium]